MWEELVASADQLSNPVTRVTQFLKQTHRLSFLILGIVLFKSFQLNLIPKSHPSNIGLSIIDPTLARGHAL